MGGVRADPYGGGVPGDYYPPDVPPDRFQQAVRSEPPQREPFTDPAQQAPRGTAGTAFPGPRGAAGRARSQPPPWPGPYQPMPPPPGWDTSVQPDISGPLPQVPAAMGQAAPPGSYGWATSGPQQVTHGGLPFPGPAGPGKGRFPAVDVSLPGTRWPDSPAISGPLPVAGWPDHPDISGPLPVMHRPDYPPISGPMPAIPAGAAGFDGYGTDDDYDDDYSEVGGRGDAFGWPDDDSGPIIPMDSSRRSRRRGGDRPRRRGRRRIAPLIALLVLAVFLSGAGIVGYRFLRAYVIPPDYSGTGSGTVVVQILPGQTATDVARTLVRLGVVASTRAFVKAAEQSSQSTGLEPGYYRLHQHMKALLAFDLLLAPGSRIQTKITIPEGLRLTQIIATLSAKSGLTKAAYQAALANPASLGLPSYAKNRPEGYLFPATYPVQPGMTAVQVLRAMVTQFNNEAAKINLAATASSVNLTPSEAVIVASLVQAEGGRVSDYPKIARVIYNRLDSGMPLQLDSTVMYAVHSYGILASTQQTQVKSAYNTYLNTGLPPGPIDSPGEAAIQAALHPANGTWLYFVTVNPKTGVTQFTSSFARFNQLKAELEHNLGK